MHIAEGFLPAAHALGWTAVATPVVVAGFRSIQRISREKPEIKLLLGVAGAFTFGLSALKLPSLTGSCSHPTGTGLGALLFGPWAMAPLGTIVLLFQALLLAHGGLTTLGANAVAMAVVGPWVAWSVYRGARWAKRSRVEAVFLAATLGDLCTYVATAAQLAFAFPDPAGGFAASILKFGAVFSLTQVPLAVVEGVLTVLMVNFLTTSRTADLSELGGIRPDILRT